MVRFLHHDANGGGGGDAAQRVLNPATAAVAPSVWRARTIGPADLRHDGNIFTPLRWLLASAVMISHGWDLTQPQRGLDPTVALLSFPISALAVYLFFTLSGFLVTGSLIKRGVPAFALARALRLLPGLWVMLLVTTAGLGLWFAGTGFGAFLAEPLTHAYVWRNALLLGGEYRLPGVFDGQPFPGVVNGSLWTIPQEVRCYIVLALCGAVGLLLRRGLLTLLFAVAAVVHLLLPPDLIPWLAYPRRLGFAFFLGVLCYLWRERLPLSWPAALGAAALALLVPDGPGRVMAIQTAFGYLVLVAAFRVPGAWKAVAARLPDYSYGIYIYAFPMQQLAVALGLGVTPLTNLATGFALTLPLAALSWHAIEKPALALKTRSR